MSDRRCVILPTYEREELLWLCLEHIRAADATIDIHVWPDRGTDCRAVCAAFPATFHHLTIQHTYHGNSYNMLEALKWAYDKKYDHVYVIEDDALISPTFFAWADAALASYPTAFAACGWSFSPDAPAPHDGPDYLLPWYLSVCCALPRRSLAAIVPHARPEYYSDMRAYADATFPSSVRRGTLHYEQDGLLLRIAESQSRMCAWPRRPRAVHAGWYGYHAPSGARLEGTLADRVRICRLILDNPSLLKSLLAGGPRPEIDYCRSCHKPILTTDRAAIVECVECFHAAHADLPRAASSHYYLPRLSGPLSESHSG